jgi:hypothetical protein
VRFDRTQLDRYIVFFKGARMGEARALDLHANAQSRMPVLTTD